MSKIPKWVKILMIIAGLFFMFFLGVLITNRVYVRQLNRVGSYGFYDESCGPGGMGRGGYLMPHELMMKKWSRLLDLTDEQEEQIEEILYDHRSDFVEIRLEMRDSLEEMFMDISEELEDVLDEEQKEDLQEFIDERFGFENVFGTIPCD